MANGYDKTHRLITFILVVMIGACLAIFAQTFRLKVFMGDKYRRMIAEKTQTKVPIEAVRGDILARDGRKLACSVPNYKIIMDPCTDGLPDDTFNKYIDKLSLQLADFYGDKSAAAYKERIQKARLAGKRYLVINPRRISYSELKKVEKFAIFKRGKNKGGMTYEQSDKRKLPFGLLAERTIGKLYSDKELGGMVGLENAYNKVLKGKNGVGDKMLVTGKWIQKEDVPPEDGRDLVTTIDIDIQDVAEYSLMNQLKAHEADHGVAMLMEVKTGAIRAIVNLHRQADGSYAEDFYNYAIGELAEPGSTFKLATMMACLDERLATPEDTIDTYDGEFKIHDQVMRDSKVGGHGKISLQRAFELSSNIAFSRLVMKCFGSDPQRFVNKLHDLGLCDSLGLDIKGERRTEIKDVSDPTWSGISLPWMSIGYEVRITPLQLLTFYNAVANNGTMMKPMFVECQLEDNKRVNVCKPKVMRNSIASKRTINAVREMLKGVVENGTAQNIKDTPYKIAGKTGTAQIAQGGRGYKLDGKKSYLASFAGFFPADNPLYSCIVMVYGPNRNVYYGNVVAGNVVKAIADRVYAAEFRRGTANIQAEVPSTGKMPWSKGGRVTDLMNVLTQLRIPHNLLSNSSEWASATAGEKSISLSARHFVDATVPSVIGMGAADAVSLLENVGMRVRLSGTGRVRTQNPEAGTTFARGTQIKLELDN